MSSFGYDPEVPAGYQDADLEALEYADQADSMLKRWDCEYRGCLRKAVIQGVCAPHYKLEQKEMGRR